jgi:Heterokaryon incompatibility protein (HET)
MYEYKRLESNNHIRVLILDPSQDASAPLQCSIKQQELGTTTEPYECISYTWGDQILAQDLYCDDGSVVEITANLHSALSRFRSNSRARCLWADAVCIKQADSEEKSRQIPPMPRIYRNASHVLVWLGSGMDGESETMQSLSRLEMLPDRFSFASRQDQGIVQRVEPQSAEARESIRRFFQLPWFGRRWVVQEAVLNPDVVFCCGLTEISWPRLHLAIESLPDYIWNDTSGSKVRKSLQKLVISGEHGHIFPKQRLIASPSTFWVHFIISSVKKIKTGSMPLLAWQAMFKHQPR